MVRVGRMALIAGAFAALGLLAVLVAMAVPSPDSVTTSTNACSGCHGGSYTLYVRIDSMSVPTSIGTDATTVSVVVSLTGNEGSKPASAQSFYVGDLTVSAASQSGLLSVSGSPASYTSVTPECSQTVTFTVTGKTAGTDSLVFTARLRPKHNPSDTTRSITARASVDVSVNTAPVLSGGSVSPASGGPSATFTFSVVYRDANGDAPQHVTMALDGTPYAMAPADGMADGMLAGETYSVALAATGIGVGAAHSFSFSASDGKADATGDTGARTGPTVEADRPPVVTVTYPTGGQLGGPIDVTGTASDPDPGAVVDRVEVTVGDGAARTATGTSEWSLSTDLTSLPDGPLAIRAVAWSGGLSSTGVRVDVTVNNAVVNIPPLLTISLPNGTAIPSVAWLNGTVVHPEPEQGAPRVLVGVGSSPTMVANVTEGPDGWHWSILLDIAALPEGPVTVQAVALDPYSSSPVDARTLVHTPPGSHPTVTVDPIGSPGWGSVTLSGTASDPDGTPMRATVSIDGATPVPVEVTAGRWELAVDLAAMPEGEHTLVVEGTDGRATTTASTSFSVMRPVVPVAPTLGLTEPMNPVEVTVGGNATFRAYYMGGDDLGIAVVWLYDGLPLNATPIDGGTEVTVALGTNGTHGVAVTISNALAPSLSVFAAWDVLVTDIPPPPPPPTPVLSIGPVGPTEVQCAVGDAVLLRFDVLEGASASVQWTSDGVPAGSDRYMVYMPPTIGTHLVGVSVEDGLGNVARLTFLVAAAEAPATPAATGPSTGSAPLSPVGAGVIGAMLMLLVVTAAWTVGRVAEARGRGAERGGAKKAPPKEGAPKPPRQAKAVPSASAEGAGAPREHRPTPKAPRDMPISVRPMPLERPCIVCGGRTVLVQARGAYWCHICQQYHPPVERLGPAVDWSKEGAA